MDSPPTELISPSSFELMLPCMNTCQVCNRPAHGYHFGALTCRACAAFFRRSHFSQTSDQNCRYGTSKCIPDTRGRWDCKKCRMDRCISRGMSTKNIQYNRDAFKSSDKFLEDRKLVSILRDRVSAAIKSTTVSLPPVVSFTQREISPNRVITYVDMSGLVSKASEALRFIPNNVEGMRRMSCLEQLTRGLVDYRSSQSDVLWEAPFITQEASLSGWEENLCSVARWMNYSDEIRKLPHDVKMKLLQCFWIIWGKLERIAMTARMRVNRQCGKKQFVVTHEALIDYERMKADTSWWSRFSYEELEFLFAPRDMFYDELVWKIIDVQPDQVELTYLLCNLCMRLTGKSVQGEVESVTDRLQETLANDLHEYYTKHQKIQYALRLKQLMKINEHFLKLRNIRCEKYHVCSKLSVFESHLSHSEYFRIPC